MCKIIAAFVAYGILISIPTYCAMNSIWGLWSTGPVAETYGWNALVYIPGLFLFLAIATTEN